eukprot:352694-Chlamydomonas_euryale.AAC.3
MGQRPWSKFQSGDQPEPTILAHLLTNTDPHPASPPTPCSLAPHVMFAVCRRLQWQPWRPRWMSSHHHVAGSTMPPLSLVLGTDRLLPRPRLPHPARTRPPLPCLHFPNIHPPPAGGRGGRRHTGRLHHAAAEFGVWRVHTFGALRHWRERTRKG